jgi:hypothetical protein
MNLSKKNIASLLGAIICGLLALWLFGTFVGLLAAIGGWFLGAFVYDQLIRE